MFVWILADDFGQERAGARRISSDHVLVGVPMLAVCNDGTRAVPWDACDPIQLKGPLE